MPVSSKTYANMYAAYASARQLEEADRVWDLMVANGMKLYEDESSAIVEALMAAQFYEKAQTVCMELETQGWAPSVELKSALAQHLQLAVGS